MDSAEPVSFDEFLDSTLENLTKRMFQGLKLLQQYLNVMGILRYDGNDKRWL